MRSAPAIGFEYRPSRLLILAALLLIPFAMLAIAASGIPLWLAIALEVFVLAYGTFSSWRFLHPRVRTLTWRSDGSVSIGLSDRAATITQVQGELQDARVFGFLIALDLRWTHGRAGLWLLPDNLDADTRRRLRIRLSLDGAHASVNADSV